MTSIQSKNATGRIEAFDSLRGLAAIGVVLWHYGAHFEVYPLFNLFFPFYRAGYLLVDFFFVLSGYVIARAYWRQSRRMHLLGNIRSRVARLYPLHLFTLLAVALMQWSLLRQGHPAFVYSENSPYHFVLNLLMLNGVGFQNNFSFNGPSWSISTEFVVNCAFMIFIASAAWARGLYVLIGIAVATLLFSISHVLLRDNHVLGYLDPQLVRCMLGFSAGVSLQLAHRHDWFVFKNLPNWLVDVLGGLTLLGSITFMATQRPHANVISYLVFISLSVALLALVFRPGRVSSFLQLRPLVMLGEISYSIYLIHFPLQLFFVLIGSWSGRTLPFGSLWVLGIYFLALIGLSYLTYRYIELPCQALLKPARQVKVTTLTAPT